MTHSPLAFAREELSRYTRRMDAAFDCSRIDFLPFNDAQNTAHRIRDCALDDAYEISVCQGAGAIHYANERSALLAVYHLLREAGCHFLTPGPTGEIVPQCNLSLLTVSLSVTAAHRHRGICIEGSNRLDNVLDMIDYAPKAGYNTYFTQFMDCYTFFERWYTHMDNPLRSGIPFTECMAQSMLQSCVREIKRRGLLYHAVGHGWTCEPFGIPGKHWESDGMTATEEQSKHLALVNGKRELFRGIGLNTNLCYSRPDTRRIMADYIAAYALSHPEIDVLHIWLADDNNNHCECENCAKMIPSDYYVLLLNEIDEALTKVHSHVRVAFLLYFELLIPPEKLRIQTPDRFLLMYAPITRRFSTSYLGLTPRYNGQKYIRNRMRFSSDVAENLGFLQKWQETFPGDGFDFDYHLCCVSGLCDAGGLNVSRVLHDDVKALHTLGLDGMVNCQFQRVVMPHAFGLFIGGQTQLHPDIDYEQALQQYFRAFYGENCDAALDFLNTLSALVPLDDIRNYHPCQTAMEKLSQLRDYCTNHVLPPCRAGHPVHKRHYRLLTFWQQLWVLTSEYLRLQMLQDEQARKQAFRALESFVWENEPLWQGEFDAYYFLHYHRMRTGD